MTATNAAVSVVIPCYNQARFLRESIQSALRQTCRPVDVIVVDDGSTDETATIARTYSDVTYVRQANAGAPSARNRGLGLSQGEFVLFLDADDRLWPEALSQGVAALADHADWAFVTGHVRLIAADGTPETVPPQEHAAGDQFLALLRSNYIWTPGVVLYRRSVLESCGAFDPAARASADYELNIRIARQHAIGCHHAEMLDYRRHGDNMSADVGEMLRSAVSVRLRQRRFVVGRPEAHRAWKEGMEIVRADFGERLIDQVKRDLQEGRVARAAKGFGYLSRYYPGGLLRTAVASVRSPASA
jgi:glycosyltransferase involved in cell wall biosynthesis